MRASSFLSMTPTSVSASGTESSTAWSAAARSTAPAGTLTPPGMAVSGNEPVSCRPSIRARTSDVCSALRM